MIGFYDYTVILTYVGFASGMLGIFSAVNNLNIIAIVCLMISGFCDMFDGQVARTKKRTDNEKKFGIQIDSLSDVICFGVLPAVIGYSLGLNEWYFLPILIIYVLAALIRLAYFNVMEEERQAKTTEKRKQYEGLPVTTVAVVLPLVYSLKLCLGKYFYLIYGAFLLLIAVAFITKIKIIKPKKTGMIILVCVGLLELVLLVFKYHPEIKNFFDLVTKNI